MIKVSAIVVFIMLGAASSARRTSAAADRAGRIFTLNGGFLPHGWLGVWMALSFVIFSFIGTEIVAVTAGEAKDPERSVPRAMRTMLVRLVIFYVGAITVLVGVIPWTQIQPGQSITVSPFVRVFDVMHVPIAAQIVNFVVLTAALSGMNCSLYLATRMIFSLARGGYAPEALGRVSRTRHTDTGAADVGRSAWRSPRCSRFCFPARRTCTCSASRSSADCSSG